MAFALRINHRLCAAAALVAAGLFTLLATLVAGMFSVALEPRGASMPPSHSESLNELPMALGQAASDEFGGAQVAYWLKPVRGGGLAGINPTQRLRLRSETSGIEVANERGMHVRLTLARASADGLRFDLSHVVARLDKNRLVYDAGAVRQYFVNGPLGVEQRFSIRRAPVAVAGQVDLVVSVSGAHPMLLPGGKSALLATGNGPVLRYAGLRANDSRGRPLTARMRLRRDELVLEVDTRGAPFPITVDPLLSSYAMLTGPAGNTSAFGSSVALSGDGNTAAVSGASDDGGVGALWVFTRAGSRWSQQGPKLTPQGPNPAFAPPLAHNFGAAIAISADGSRIVVGDGRLGVLAVWVFVRSNGVWHQQGPPLSHRVVGTYSSGSEAVALSGDGKTLAFDGAISNNPLAWIYVWLHGRWRQQGRPLNALAGSLALSANGNTLLVGTASYLRSGSHWRAAGGLPTPPGAVLGFSAGTALSADGKTAIAADRVHGYALVYRRSHTRWSRVAQLSSPHPEPQLAFAEGVHLSADGNTALIAAAPRSESSGAKAIAYIFTRTAEGTWTPSPAPAMNQPWNAALSADGATIVAPPLLREVFEQVESSGGPAQVFTRAGSGWQEQGTLAPADATGVDSGSFGVDFALSADGGTALVSEGGDVAWVFGRSGDVWTRQARLGLEGTTGGGASVALSSDGNTAVLAGPSDPGPVAAWVFSRTNGTWSARGTPLVASGAGPRPPGSTPALESFASSVAVSANGAVILVGASWDSGRTGAAWVFVRSGGAWIQQGQKLTPSNPSPEERFGDEVALSGDGNLALVGAVGDRHSPPEGSAAEGAAYVFTRAGATWNQVAKLIDGEPNRYETTREVGGVVALSADGNTVLLGADRRVLVFTKAPTGWQQHHSLTPSGFGGSTRYSGEVAFGDVIALSASGEQALVSGLPREGCGKYMDEPCSAPAVVWAFDRAGETWIRQPLPLVAGRSVGGHLALSGDGALALLRGVTPGPEPGGAVRVSHVTPPPLAGFVIEPANVEYEGLLELALWSPVPATLKATARINSPGVRVASGCARSRRVKRMPTKRRCPVRAFLYGTASAKGIENVRLSIAPRPRATRYLERHKRARRDYDQRSAQPARRPVHPDDRAHGGLQEAPAARILSRASDLESDHIRVRARAQQHALVDVSSRFSVLLVFDRRITQRRGE